MITKSRFKQTTLRKANLTGAQFTNCILLKADFKDAVTTGAKVNGKEFAEVFKLPLATKAPETKPHVQIAQEPASVKIAAPVANKQISTQLSPKG